MICHIDFFSDIEKFKKDTISKKHFNESEANYVMIKCKV